MKGIISKGLTKDRAFVFIQAEDGIEYFLHRDSFKENWNQLEEGHPVEFTNTISKKGPRAEDCVFFRE